MSLLGNLLGRKPSEALAPVSKHRAGGLAEAPRVVPLKRPTRGMVDHYNPEIRRIVVRLDEATFEQVARRAEADGVTTTEAVRRLIKRGLKRG